MKGLERLINVHIALNQDVANTPETPAQPGGISAIPDSLEVIQQAATQGDTGQEAPSELQSVVQDLKELLDSVQCLDTVFLIC